MYTVLVVTPLPGCFPIGAEDNSIPCTMPYLTYVVLGMPLLLSNFWCQQKIELPCRNMLRQDSWIPG
jgi:hypothetical protein